jgi:hypothetical protein
MDLLNNTLPTSLQRTCYQLVDDEGHHYQLVDDEGHHYQLLDYILDARKGGKAVERGADGYVTRTKSGKGRREDMQLNKAGSSRSCGETEKNPG